jgi:hypothetical protein
MIRLVPGLAAVATALLMAASIMPAVAADPAPAAAPTASPPPAPVKPATWCRAGDMAPVSLENCRLAGDASVKVFWDDPSLIDAATADAVIASTREAMGRYKGLGLTAADISGLNVVDVAVLPGDGTPDYSWKLGKITIGAVSAKKIASGDLSARLELWHELIHWIQDEAYFMGLAALSGESTWWLETSAEVGTFLIDAEAADHNATLYGRTGLPDLYTLAFQLSPHQWATKEQYLHAQRLWSDMCPSGCPISQQGFVDALNTGTYPFSDQAARDAMAKAIERYANYVLTGSDGSHPVTAAFENGTAIGDNVVILADSKRPWRLDTSSYKPQIDKDAGTIAAALQPDSVYPLVIASGPDAAPFTGQAFEPGAPAMLVVEAGTEFWYTLDGGKVQHHDGATRIEIGPIHAGIGTGTVRLVAAAHDTGTTLRAKLEPVTFEGDWVFSMKGKVRITGSTCKDISKSATGSGKGPDLIEMLTSYVATKGTYEVLAAEQPGDLLWVQQKPFDGDAGDRAARYTSEIHVGATDISASFAIETGKPSTSAGDSGLPLGLMAALVPLGLLPFLRRRHLLGGVAILSLAALLSGCVGVGLEIAADIDADMHFAHLEKVADRKSAKAGKQGGKPSGGKAGPLWRLTGGKADLDVDLAITAETTDGKSKDKETRSCHIEMTVGMVAELYPDGVVKPPKMS